MDDPPASRSLSITVSHLGLAFRDAVRMAGQFELGFVQLDAAAPGMRPRELDRSARRDLAAFLRRREVSVSGIDLWIPPSHFEESNHVDRAVSAASEAIRLAADLGRVPIALTLPRSADAKQSSAITELVALSNSEGVSMIDYAAPLDRAPAGVRLGIDPVSCRLADLDPVSELVKRSDDVAQIRLRDLDEHGSIMPLAGAAGRIEPAEFAAILSVHQMPFPPVIDTRGWSNVDAGVRRTLSIWT